VKVLQLFNNWKWTGPAEYALNLAAELTASGIDTIFACGRPPAGEEENTARIARERGLEPVTDFSLSKHFDLRAALTAVRGLRQFIERERITLLHTHLTNGHLLGALAVRGTQPRPALIRTCYESSDGTIRDRLLSRYAADGIIAVSTMTQRSLTGQQRIPAEKVLLAPAAIDTHRFDPARGTGDNRACWGIAPDTPVVGIVARVQMHRRFHIFLEAVRLACREIPDLKVMVIGRGTHISKLAVDPVHNMGLQKHFVFTGYRKEDYVETLNCLDIKIFLVPGSDGSCRAVREAMALGKPIIAARRGMLPEIVDHAVNGLIIDDSSPASLASAIVYLVRNKTVRLQYGQDALKKAHSEYSLKLQAKKIVAFYEAVLAARTPE